MFSFLSSKIFLPDPALRVRKNLASEVETCYTVSEANQKLFTCEVIG
jgi:hypothetical protein